MSDEITKMLEDLEREVAETNRRLAVYRWRAKIGGLVFAHFAALLAAALCAYFAGNGVLTWVVFAGMVHFHFFSAPLANAELERSKREDGC